MVHHDTETYFLVTWIEATDGEVLYDVVNCKSVVPPECSNVLDVTEGTVCRVAYTDGQYYKAKILNIGKFFVFFSYIIASY